MSPILVDTNVLVYFYDQNSSEKQERASLVLNRLREAGLGRLSTQTLAEFVNAAMRKHLSPGEYYMVVMGNVTKDSLGLKDVEWIE